MEMRILFWVPYPTDGASNRYRVEQYLPYLKDNGIVCSLRPFWTASAYKILYKKGFYIRKFYYFILGVLYRFYEIFQIKKYDLVFIHRESYPLGGIFFEAILLILKKPIIFDFDDAIFLSTSSQSNSFFKKFKGPGKIPWILNRSRVVIAGNQYLADFTQKYNRNVYVIPTCIDTDKYCPLKRENKPDKIVIGWIGSTTTISFLNLLKDVMLRLTERYPQVILKIIGGEFSIAGLNNIISKPWSIKEEIEDLSTFDIGIMPMPDNCWTRGKCGFKAILYMSMAIPTVCSPVGVNKQIITDGENGFLADSTSQWIDKLSRLIEVVDFRKRIGYAARETIKKRFSLKVGAPMLLNILKTNYHNAG